MADLATTPIVVDADDIAQVGFDRFAAYYPGWQPTDGDFTTRFVQMVAGMIAENQSLATQGVSELITFFGTVLGLPPFAATAASASSTWTLLDNAGHTIPAGTNVALGTTDGTPVTFSVAADVVVAPGSTATTFGQVQLVAADPGAQGTGLTGPVVLLDELAFVDTGTGSTAVVLTGPSTGGVDAESTSAYLARFQKFALVVAPRPIIASDFALLTQVLFPEVQRCLAIDEYNADTATAAEPRCVTVVPVDATGLPVSSLTLSAIKTELLARREINFETFAIAPTYTTINITFTAVAVAGYDPTDVQTRAVAALTAMLSPATWGLPPTGDVTSWIDQPKVRFQDAVTTLNNVEGLDYYTALTVQGGTADVTLTGPGALPLAGTISGTVNSP